MNTDSLTATWEVEQVELAIRRMQQAARSDLMSWVQFVFSFCERHCLSYSSVISDEIIMERLNIMWLRSDKRFTI